MTELQVHIESLQILLIASRVTSRFVVVCWIMEVTETKKPLNEFV